MFVKDLVKQEDISDVLKYRCWSDGLSGENRMSSKNLDKSRSFVENRKTTLASSCLHKS